VARACAGIPRTRPGCAAYAAHRRRNHDLGPPISDHRAAKSEQLPHDRIFGRDRCRPAAGSCTAASGRLTTAAAPGGFSGCVGRGRRCRCSAPRIQAWERWSRAADRPSTDQCVDAGRLCRCLTPLASYLWNEQKLSRLWSRKGTLAGARCPARYERRSS